MKTLIAQPENVFVKGKHTRRVYDLKSLNATVLFKRLQKTKRENPKYAQLEKWLSPYMKLETVEYNVICLDGKQETLKRWGGKSTGNTIITHGALGSGVTAVNTNDHQLTTEVFRKVPASTYIANNVLTIDFYFNKGDTNGTYNEWGTFFDGTSTANSGIIFSHLLTSGWTKTSNEGMTVTCDYTFN